MADLTGFKCSADARELDYLHDVAPWSDRTSAAQPFLDSFAGYCYFPLYILLAGTIHPSHRMRTSKRNKNELIQNSSEKSAEVCAGISEREKAANNVTNQPINWRTSISAIFSQKSKKNSNSLGVELKTGRIRIVLLSFLGLKQNAEMAVHGKKICISSTITLVVCTGKWLCISPEKAPTGMFGRRRCNRRERARCRSSTTKIRRKMIRNGLFLSTTEMCTCLSVTVPRIRWLPSRDWLRKNEMKIWYRHWT